MATTTLALLAFLALGVATLLWAIHELTQGLEEDEQQDQDPPSGG